MLGAVGADADVEGAERGDFLVPYGEATTGWIGGEPEVRDGVADEENLGIGVLLGFFDERFVARHPLRIVGDAGRRLDRGIALGREGGGDESDGKQGGTEEGREGEFHRVFFVEGNAGGSKAEFRHFYA